MSTLRKLLFTLMIIGGVGSTISAGTFASYTSTTTNKDSAFATGSLVLSRTIGATACVSTAGGSTDSNLNSSCSLMINPNRIRPGETATVDLTIKAGSDVSGSSLGGTLNYRAADLDPGVGTASCTVADNGAYGSVTMLGDLCANTNVTIQEYNAGFTTPTATCVYPALGVSCPALTAGVAPAYPTSSIPVTDTSLGNLSAGASRYFRLTMQLSNTVDDTMQDRVASLALAWSLTGA